MLILRTTARGAKPQPIDWYHRAYDAWLEEPIVYDNLDGHARLAAHRGQRS